MKNEYSLFTAYFLSPKMLFQRDFKHDPKCLCGKHYVSADLIA